MIGPLSPHLCQLSPADRVYYRNLYCGVCKSLKNRFGRISTLTLSHDVAFLGLLFPQQPQCPSTSVPCTLYPWRKVLALPEENPIIQSCLLINTIFSFCKYYDHQQDGDPHSWKYFFFRKLFREGTSLLEQAGLSESELQEIIAQQIQVESLTDLSIEAYTKPVANLSARLFGQFFAVPENESLIRLLGRLYIQMIALYDGIQDYQEDQQQNRFNLFLCLEKKSNRKDAFEQVHLVSKRFLNLALEVCPEENRKLLHDSFCFGFISRLKNVEQNLWTNSKHP
ncbi:MAG: DUF5685 family protein [Planctomycetota bacterium]